MKTVFRILLGMVMAFAIICTSCKGESYVKERQPKKFSNLMELAEYVRTLDSVSFDEGCELMDQAGTFMLNAKFKTQDDVIDMKVAYNEYIEVMSKLKTNFNEEDLTSDQIEYHEELRHRIRRGENVMDARIRAAGLHR